MSSDIGANIEEMLQFALTDKAKKLAPVKGFDRKALLLWNTYFFGGDVSDIERALSKLMDEVSNFSIFDNVLYVIDAKLWVVYERNQR